jgi:hypothetical protein
MAQLLLKRMKKIYVVRYIGTILLTFCTLFTSYGQTAERDQISAAILTGNAKAISAFFIASIDLTVLNTEDVYSKEQAEVILSKFFSENKPSAFDIKHQGKSKLEDYFYIGDLNTNKGQFRLTFFLKKEANGFRVKQFRIEPAE